MQTEDSLASTNGPILHYILHHAGNGHATHMQWAKAANVQCSARRDQGKAQTQRQTSAPKRREEEMSVKK